jgi:uncharacterized membrane protein YsdA (DUF1294 family)
LPIRFESLEGPTWRGTGAGRRGSAGRGRRGGLWLAGAAAFAAAGVLPTWVAIWYAVASLIAFAAYAADKGQAGAEGPRISERALHALEAMGGWPGALVAQRQFRHKTRKTRFQVIFWLIVTAHVGAAAAWLYFRFSGG